MADNTIIVEGSEFCIALEGEAGGAISPGHLLTVDSNGEYVAHDTADGVNTYLYADVPIDPAKDVDDAYVAGEQVRVVGGRPGVAVRGIVGESQTIAPGDLLVSDGDGTLVERAAEAYGVTVAIALESVTTGSSAESLCLMRLV